MQLFPRLSATWDGVMLTLTNEGDSVIRTAEYGEPSYRAIVKLFDRDQQIADRWLALPRDLYPGQSAQIEVAASRATRLTLTHALQDIPLVDETPAIEVELVR